jgi:tetrahydromethanopterin S-methyltransferase subunit E
MKYRLLGFGVGILLIPLDSVFHVSDSLYMAALVFTPITYFLFGLIIQLIFISGFFQKNVENKTKKIASYWIYLIAGLLIFFFSLSFGLIPFVCSIPNFCHGY